jgi:ribosomal protein S18 acetylase RimI-like enzyme
MSSKATHPFMLRHAIRSEDVAIIRALCERAGNFTAEEIDIAIEVAQDGLHKGSAKSGYYFVFCENDAGTVVGYASYGPIPLTDRRYEIYWIVVDPGQQRKGIGSILMQECERLIREMGGEYLYLDTSAKESYDATRAFYDINGFVMDALLKDFYRRHDDKVIYKKTLAGE